MTYKVRFTPEAEDDLIRLYDFILARDAGDFRVAVRHQRESDYH